MKRLGLTGVGVATVAALAWNAPAMAGDSVEDRLTATEKRVKYLEERVAAQDRMIVEKDAALSGMEDAWHNNVEIGGKIELELVNSSPAEGDSGTEMGVGKAELAIGAALDDEWGGEIVVKDDDGIVLDGATLTYEPAGGGFSATAGLQGLPFGVYGTNLITDPLTKQLGETAETSLVVGGEAGQMGWSVFAFGGDAMPETETNIAGFGAAVGFANEVSGGEIGADLSWISHIGDSDTLGEDASYADQVAGIAASARASFGDAQVLFEYVAALDAFGADELDFEGSGATPTAWTAEFAYSFAMGDRDATVAVATSSTAEAASAGLAETLMLLGISVGLGENVGVGLEWSQRDAYDPAESEDAITVQLAAEF